MGAACFALLALADGASAAPAPDAGVTTTAPVNSERHPPRSARRTGAAVRAIAAVRAAAATSATIESEVVDLATEKALVTSVPRPARDEDLYRALALKIQALLR